MKKPYIRNLSFGLLGAAVLAFLCMGCPDSTDDPVQETTKYTVTFNSQGGSAVPSQTVAAGEKAVAPTAPTKADNTFAGWFTEAATTSRWDFAVKVVTQNITLYAKWVPGTVTLYTITFNTDGGSAIAPLTGIASGETIQLSDYKPAKTGFVFRGWHNTSDTANPQSTVSSVSVTGNITLKALWVEELTVTFETNGGTAIPPIKKGKGESLYPANYSTTKSNSVFDGWYKDAACTISAGSAITLTGNITLYAKWTSNDALAPYIGVWKNSSGSETYLLNNDGTGWSFSSYSTPIVWNRSTLGREGSGDQYTLALSDGTLTLTSTWGSPQTFTKQTVTKTPAGSSALTGIWFSSSTFLDIKNNGSAVVSSDSDTITLGYRIEGDTLYLVQQTTNLVVMTITIENNKLTGGFSKTTSDASLLGIWQITHQGTASAYQFKANGEGVFYLFGAQIPFTYKVTEDKKINIHGTGNSTGYTVSGSQLQVPSKGMDGPITLIYTKVTAAPSGSGAGGDSRLHGTWKGLVQGVQASITFKADGTMEQQYGSNTNKGIWKAVNGQIYLYSPIIDDSDLEGSPMPYSISGSTLTLDGEMVFTKQ